MQRLGYAESRRRGSHVRLSCPGRPASEFPASPLQLVDEPLVAHQLQKPLLDRQLQVLPNERAVDVLLQLLDEAVDLGRRERRSVGNGHHAVSLRRPYTLDMRRAVAEEALEEVRRIVTERLKGCEAMVVLFGSRASGSARVASDIDVAVLPRHALPTGVLGGIREALEESHVPYRVDVVDLSLVDPAFRERVLETGVIWAA